MNGWWPALVSALGDAADSIVELVLPRSCIGCGAHGTVLCAGCRPSAPVVTGGVIAAGAYEGALRAALLAYKERGRRDLTGTLGELLADSVLRSNVPLAAPSPVLAPVPSSRSASRDRGGDHMLRLARVTSRRTGLRVARPLSLTRRVQDSAGLTVVERAANLHAAMVATVPPVRGSRVIVLDDIITTGVTLTEASRALAAAGWRVCGAATIAATPRRTAESGTARSDTPVLLAPARREV